MRILLIEDDQKAAVLLARGLQEEGFLVDVAHSAEIGDEQMYATDYDLLILDWLLPGKDGLALCRELRQRRIQLPILMLTALSPIASPVSIQAPTITSPSRSRSTSCLRACARCCDARTSRARWCSRSVISHSIPRTNASRVAA